MMQRRPMSQRERKPNILREARTVQKSKNTMLNLFLLIMTLVVGFFMWWICLFFYYTLIDIMPRPVLIGIMFGIFSGMLSISVFLASNLRGEFEQNIFTGDSSRLSTVIVLFLAHIILFVLAMLFQWIYGLNFHAQLIEPTSYIFAIDDSGSMEQNDPENIRYQAVKEVLKDRPDSFSYMIYSFSDDVSIRKEMGTIAEGMPEIVGQSSGGTAIKRTLNQILADYRRGAWKGGKNPKIVLLTDGFATDLGWFDSLDKVLRGFAKEGISISTVGLGEVDVKLMTQIAESTGGVFVDVQDLGGLSGAMTIAATQYTSRDLLSSRFISSGNLVYAFLRILFLSILGVAIGLIVAIAYGLPDSLQVILVSSMIKSVVGAITLELGTLAVAASDKLLWLFLWILIATTIAIKVGMFRGRSQRVLGR